MRTSIIILALASVSLWLRGDEARSGAAEHPAPHLGTVQFERLSYDLRGRRLDDAERKAIQEATAAGDKAAKALYTKDVDTWLTKDSLKSFVSTYLRYPAVLVVTPDAEPFFQRLARAQDVYYLPGAAPTDKPCADKDVASVAAWWSKTPVKICTASYVPDHIFDEVGYCSGEAEPLMRQPARPGCGCGPLLMGCLPPAGENAPLDQAVKTAVGDEYSETAARIVSEGHSLDELVTTSRTWQSGLAEFLYARREAIADYRKAKWGPDLEKRIAARLHKVDVLAPGKWIDRKGAYQGTGLWWTALVHQSLKIPVRPASHHLLDRYLCMPFTSVNVDADAVLKAVGDKQANLRTLSSLTAAPMRFQAGCKGCHSPMDGAAGFMGDIQGPIYGSYVTGTKSAGEFFVGGDKDFRGKGTGSAALAKLVIGAPEFESCAVRRAYEQVFQAPPGPSDQPAVGKLVEKFHKNGHRWVPIIKELLESDGYLYPAPPPPAPAAPAEVPPAIAKTIGSACTGCHNDKNPLDLTKLPPPSETAIWKKILTKVSDSSMPPPRVDDAIADRFPLDPGERRGLVGALTKMLGGTGAPPLPPRRMPHAVWVSIVRAFAEPSIGKDKVTASLDPLLARQGFFGKLPPRGLPPPYVLALEQVSEAVCRDVAAADETAKRYGVTGGDWNADAKTASVTKLMTAVYGTAPTSADLQTEVGVLDNFHQATGDWREAWVGLCSTELSGPRLFFADYIARSTP